MLPSVISTMEYSSVTVVPPQEITFTSAAFFPGRVMGIPVCGFFTVLPFSITDSFFREEGPALFRLR